MARFAWFPFLAYWLAILSCCIDLYEAKVLEPRNLRADKTKAKLVVTRQGKTADLRCEVPLTGQLSKSNKLTWMYSGFGQNPNFENVAIGNRIRHRSFIRDASIDTESDDSSLSSTLSLINVTPSSAGIYKCLPDTGVGDPVVFHVAVVDGRVRNYHEVYRGRYVSFPCFTTVEERRRVSNNYEISWVYSRDYEGAFEVISEGKTIVNDRHKALRTEATKGKTDERGTYSWLVLKDLAQFSAGYYSCFLLGAGSVVHSDTYQLAIHETLNANFIARPLEREYNATVKCEIDKPDAGKVAADYGSRIKWDFWWEEDQRLVGGTIIEGLGTKMFEGAEIKASLEGRGNTLVPTLEIHKATRRHIGQYKCSLSGEPNVFAIARLDKMKDEGCSCET